MKTVALLLAGLIGTVDAAATRLRSTNATHGAVNVSYEGHPTLFLQGKEKAHRDRPMLWWHVHKAAGSYICDAARAFDHVVSPNANCNWAAHDRYVMSSSRTSYMVSCAERYAFFSQQGATWGAIERPIWPQDVCAEFDYSTILRDPISLMRSNHNFFNQVGGHLPMATAMQAVRRARRTPSRLFPDFTLGTEMTRAFDNLQVRYFGGAWDVPFGGVTREHLGEAKRQLSKFKELGVVEDLDAHGDVLFAHLGWPSRSKLEVSSRVNAGKNDFHEDFKIHDRKMLANQNKLDYELYEFVRSKTTWR